MCARPARSWPRRSRSCPARSGGARSATDEELIGLLSRWDAIGSWAEAGKLGVVRELLRRRARPGLGGAPPVHGDLPDQWEEGAGHEVSAALAISLRSADNLTAFAWDLQARLPGIGAALADGTLTPLKARIISDELKVLDDERAAQAEKLILDQLDGQTPAQLGRLAAQVVVTVDPDGAAKRRQHAEREEARVRFWRDNGGACALAAFGLPDRRGAGRQRRDQRPRRGLQGGEAAPGRADGPAAGAGVPGHPQRHHPGHPHRLRPRRASRAGQRRRR